MSAEKNSVGSAGTIENQNKMEYRDFWIRLLAWFIDALLLSFITWGFVNVIYYIGFWTWRGQTLGQMVIKNQVVRVDGKPVDLRTATLRFLGYILCFLTLGIGFLMILWDDQKQGLHDKIAKTYVIRAPGQ